MARQAWEVPRWDEDRQRILNVDERRFPKRWTDAPTPPGPIPVEARIVWELDGEEWISTRARAWTRDLVLVEVPGPRWPLNNAWIPAADVRRPRPPAPTGARSRSAPTGSAPDH